MRKFLMAIICLFIVSSTVFAQRQNQQRSPEESAKQTTEWMKTELNLTPEQVAPIDSINLVYALAQAKLFEGANGDFASVRDDMQKLNALRLEAYAEVLTADQLQAYNKAMEERRNRGGGGGAGGGGGRRAN